MLTERWRCADCGKLPYCHTGSAWEGSSRWDKSFWTTDTLNMVARITKKAIENIRQCGGYRRTEAA